MSSNKGKDGEMKVARILTYIGESENNIDFTRHTITNMPDMGADMILTHPDDFLPKLKQISEGVPSSELVESTSPNQAKSRIDVKATSNKIHVDVVKKFVSDIRKHPDCQGHILMGGKDMSGPAKKEFQHAQKVFSEENKTLMHINNDGSERIEKHYREAIENNGACGRKKLPESDQK